MRAWRWQVRRLMASVPWENAFALQFGTASPLVTALTWNLRCARPLLTTAQMLIHQALTRVRQLGVIIISNGETEALPNSTELIKYRSKFQPSRPCSWVCAFYYIAFTPEPCTHTSWPVLEYGNKGVVLTDFHSDFLTPNSNNQNTYYWPA